MPNLNLSRFIVLPNIEIISMKSENRFYHIQCKSKLKRPHCPICNDDTPRVHQSYVRTIKDTLVRDNV